MKTVFIILALLVAPLPAVADGNARALSSIITGPARIIDGDTVVVGATNGRGPVLVKTLDEDHLFMCKSLWLNGCPGPPPPEEKSTLWITGLGLVTIAVVSLRFPIVGRVFIILLALLFAGGPARGYWYYRRPRW